MPLVLKIGQPRSRKVGAQIHNVSGVLSKILKHPDEKLITFDLAKVTFVQPLFLASVSALIMQLRSSGRRVTLINANTNIRDYFTSIYFPNGLKLDQRKNWENHLNKYKGKNYIPLIYFQAGPLQKETILREKILSMVNSLLFENCELPGNIKSGVSYLIGEMTDNIVDHSGDERGWITAHYYHYKKYIEVCLVDSGCGLLGSYQNNGEDMETHSEAIIHALKGISTKSKDRGYGVHTSNNMIVKGLKGVFAILTGNSLLIDNKIVELPVSWEGTIVVLRIPIGVKNFDYAKYVE